MAEAGELLPYAARVVFVLMILTHGAHGRMQDEAPADDVTTADDAPFDPPIKLDLNRATPEELLRVPNLGKSTVERIIRGRPYKTVDDLAKVGVSKQTIESLREIVVIGPPSAPAPRERAKVDVNRADAATLQTLPGVGPTLSRAIIAGRPYRTLDDLARVRGLTTSKFAAIRDRVTIGTPAAASGDVASTDQSKPGTSTAAPSEPAPVDLNTASQQELESLPSIGPAKARAIMEHRPYRTIQDVMRVPGIKQGTFDRIKDRITVGA